jgi:hypothetical protein
MWMERQDIQKRLSIARAMVDCDMMDGTNKKVRVEPSNEGIHPSAKEEGFAPLE